MADFDVLIDTGSGLTSAAYVPGTVRISERLGAPTKASFTLLTVNPGAHAWSMGDDVAIKSDDGATTYFNGTITAHPSRPRLSSFDLWETPVQCLGDDSRLDRVRITRTYTATRGGAIITSINDTDLGAFFSTTLIQGPRIDSISFSGNTPREAFNAIAERSARLGRHFIWRVTPANDIVFERQAAATTASWSIAAGSTPIDPLTLQTSRKRGTYFNAAYVRSDSRKGDAITEKIDSWDKAQTEWGMKHPVAGFDSDGDGAVTYGTHTSDARLWGEYDETAQTDVFQWRAGVQNIYAGHLQDIGASGADTLSFTYRPKVPTVWAYRDEVDIAYRGALSGGGLYETPYMYVPGLRTTQEAIDYLRGFLTRYQTFEVVTVVFQATTKTAGVGLLTAGETMDISIPEDGINGTFIVDQVTYTDRYRGESWLMFVTARLGEVTPPPQTVLKDAVDANSNKDVLGGVGEAEPISIKTRTEDLDISVTMTVVDA